MQKTIILTACKIAKLIDMPRVLRIVEEAFRAHGENKVKMPPKIYIHLHKYNGDFRAMPAYIEGTEACGIKWVNVHVNNKKYNLPTVMAVIILSDPGTGLPLAVLDGTHITNLRTGAAGGIAAKYLANKQPASVGLVGCGVQAGFQLQALKKTVRLADISIYDADGRNAAEFLKRAKSLKLKIRKAEDIEDCVSKKDIVVTVTPSRQPIIRSGWISAGTHINAIGADAKGKEELDPSILKRGRIFVDDISQASHSGEINVPLSKNIIKISDICGTLGEVICGKVAGRKERDDITIFDSTGLAVQDIAVGNYIYKTVRGMTSRAGIFAVDFKS